MHNWRVGSVGSVSGENFWGVGFVLYDETGKPCVTFGYSTRKLRKLVVSISQLHLQMSCLSPALDSRRRRVASQRL